jgi:enoyl-CoA hydratase/carnithine racemase
MSEPTLLIEHPSTGVVVIRLNRPEVLNALNLELRQSLAKYFDEFEKDPSVRVIVLAGGPKAFCAGADLNEYVDATPSEIVSRQMGRLWNSISECSKPVISAIRGYALGGGLELAMTADIIIASEKSKLGQPEVLVGIMPGGGATQRLTRAVGKFKAMKMMLTGELCTAQEALQMGLLSEVVSDELVEAKALEWAALMARGPQVALRSIKQSILQSMNMPLNQGLEFERKSFQLLFDTKDKTEGMRARLDKRDSQFE